MRLDVHKNRPASLAVAAALAAGAGGLLAAPGPASASFPGDNGMIVTTKCEDSGTCKAAHIWTVDPASGAERQLTTGPEYDDDPSVSPNGQRVAFERCPTGSTCRISSIDTSGGNPVDLTDGSGGGQDYPAFSPDGSRIAFETAGEIYVMNADGSNQALLPGTSTGDHMPAFTADDSSIVFTRYVSGIARVFRAPLGGGSPPAPLTSGPWDWNPSVSPDGSRILFQRSGTLWIMDSSGANQHELTTPPAGIKDAQPVFSPDGSQIVFDRYDSTSPVTQPLMVMNADGSNQHAITPAFEEFTKPDWQSTHPAPAAAPAPAPAPSGPHAVLSVPRRLRAWHKARFSGARSSDAASPIVKFVWSFGDHTKRQKGRTVIHVFKRRGRYTVALTVTDAAGHKVGVTRRVTVRR